jgi:glycine dehydrogenase subunit 1
MTLPFFQEFVVRCPAPVEEINQELLDRYNIIGGYDLGLAYPELEEHMLLCVTEMNSVAQIDDLVAALEALS